MLVGGNTLAAIETRKRNSDCQPQIALPNFGRMGLQESSSDAINVVGMFEHCTRYNLKASKPSVLDVYIDPEEVPPMGERIRLLQKTQ